MSKSTRWRLVLVCVVCCVPFPASAQSQGFTPTSAVVSLDANTYYIGVEALFN